MPSQPNDRRIPSLDGLRGISILLVMIAHVRDTRGVPGFLSSPVFDHGVLGVRVFFVLSGFLITRLIVQEIQRNGQLALGRFFVRRALRIFPAFYVYLTVVLLATWAGWFHIAPRNVLFAATYTMNYVRDGWWETGHLWSLAVEEQFYLLWPVTIGLIGLRRALNGAAVLAIVAPYALLVLFLHGAGPYLLATQTFPFVFDAIAAGCVLGGYFDAFIANASCHRAIASPAGDLVPVAVLMLDSFDHHGAAYHGIGQLAITLAICYSTARYTQVAASFSARLLAARPLVWLGQRSYSLYLWQQLFLDPYQHTVLQMFPVSVGCALACANASYRFIERPLNAMRRRYRADDPGETAAPPIESAYELRPAFAPERSSVDN